MRRFSFAALICGGILCAGPAGAESPWRTMSLPAESERYTRIAEESDTLMAAAKHYAKAIRICPSNGPALFGLGGILLRQNRPADSLKVFRRMNTFFPNDPEVAVAMAITLTRLPDLDRARVREGIDQLKQVMEAQPRDIEVWHQLSILRHLNGDYAAALEAAQQALALDAEDPIDIETTHRYQQQEIACNDALLVFSPLD
jgi:tetratricopeptide (TPR) repeat protein